MSRNVSYYVQHGKCLMDLILHVRTHLCNIYLKAMFTEAKKAPHVYVCRHSVVLQLVAAHQRNAGHAPLVCRCLLPALPVCYV